MGAAAQRKMTGILLFLVCAGYFLGEIIRIPLFPGITATPLDVGALLWVGYALPGRLKAWRKRKLGFSLLAFAGVMVFSVLVNFWRYQPADIGTGVAYIFRFLLYAAVYFSLDDRQAAGLADGLLVSVAVMAVVGVLQLVYYPDLRNLMYAGWDPHYHRVFSTLLDPNLMAGVFSLAAISSFGKSFGGTKKWLVVAALAALGLFLTFSRSGYVALVVAAIYAAIRFNGRVFLPLLACAVLLVVALSVSPNQSYSILRKDTAVARLGSLSDGWRMYAGSPVIGYGYNMLRTVQLPGNRDVALSETSHALGGTDNLVFFVGSTMGIPGFVCLAFFVVAYVKRASAKKEYAWVMACMLSAVVHAQFVNSFFFPWTVLLLLTLFRSVETHLE